MTELATIDADEAREFSEAQAQIGEGWWRLNSWAFRQRIPEALGLTRREWGEQYHRYLKLPPPERREAAAELSAGGMNNSEIADALGVTEGTVRNDLKPKSEDSQNYEPEVGVEEEAQAGSLASDEDSKNYEPEMPAGQEQADAILADIDEQVAAGIDPEPDVEPEPGRDPVDDEPTTEPEAEPESEPLTPAEPGWHKLGDHLLYCGSSTDQEFVDACQGAAFAFADPPYNAGKADWDEGFQWQHDYLTDAAAIVGVTPGIASLAGFLATTQMPYRWSIAAEITNGMTAGALRFGNWICVNLFAHGSIYRQSKDHVRVPVATGDDQGGSHPSRKPLRLLTHLIELFTSKGDAVVDPFLGSGTTLMAAERTGRRCVAAELDPMYCAEIIARYNSEPR